MTDTWLVLAAVVLAGAAMAISVITFRRLTPGRGPASTQFYGITDPRYQVAFIGPVERLSFTESLDPERFANATEAVALESLQARWQSALGDGVTVTLNGVRLLSSQAEMLVTASVNGKTWIASGLASVSRHKSGISATDPQRSQDEKNH
jgi:hypothetical protein